ncbi:MAG: AAA family ATPase [Bdellovibrionales bacterium]|jgi:uridine kinase|nr:AAA family ATPase [Bdellovibrionales bacterium]
MLFDFENRILILGNSGSGKTWLSGALVNYLDLNMISLDEVCWEPGGYYKRRTDEDVKQDLLGISQRPRWVIEGVYGDLAEILLPRITCLFWLDLDPNFCAESVLKRGFENIPWMDTESKIQAYLSHIRSYQKNSGPMSREFHENVFNSYKGKKIAFKSRDAVNEFIENL